MWKNQPWLEGGGGVHARPAPFTLVTITYKVVVYAPAERADLFIYQWGRYTPPISSLPRYVFCASSHIPRWESLPSLPPAKVQLKREF
jgi:hypothetical protein